MLDSATIMDDPWNLLFVALACYLAFWLARFAAERTPTWPLIGAIAIVGTIAWTILVRAELRGRAALLGLLAFVLAAVIGAYMGRATARRSLHNANRSQP